MDLHGAVLHPHPSLVTVPEGGVAVSEQRVFIRSVSPRRVSAGALSAGGGSSAGSLGGGGGGGGAAGWAGGSAGGILGVYQRVRQAFQ